MKGLATVRLRNSDEVPAVLVTTTMLALRKLLAEQPIAFCELTERCRDPQHQLVGNSGPTLYTFGLATTSAGDIHDAVRSVVLSAVTGEGSDLALGSPLPAGE